MAKRKKVEQVEQVANIVNVLGLVKCSVKKDKYYNGRVALELFVAETDEDRGTFEGEPYTTATVNIPQADLAQDEVLIKTYSENQGVLEALVEARIVEDTGKKIQSGFVEIPICKLLTPLPNV